MSYDVIIIGGGYTGVSAAHALAHKKVLLLEADAILGGRARSVDGLDLGAHYFGKEHRRVMRLAKRLAPNEIFHRTSVYGDDPAQRALLAGEWRLTTRKTSFFDLQGLSKECPPSEWVMIFRSIALAVSLESTVNIAEPWRTPNAAALDAISMQEWIDSQCLAPWLKEMWEFAALGILSVHARDISFLYWLWYVASNGGFLKIANDYEGGPQEYSVRCGLGGLLQRYAQGLECEVRTGAPVARVDQSSPREVVVTLASGEAIRAERVIVAASPHAVGNTIRFEPELSPERRKILSQKMGHAVKAMVVYDRPFWRDSHGLHFYGYMGGPFTDAIEWVLDTSYPDGSLYALMMFVSDRMDRSRLADAAVELTGDPRAANFSRVEWFDWGRAPYIGGGPNTSFRPGVLSTLTKPLISPEDRVFFASAEQSTEFTGYVEGAMAAGEHVAALLDRPRKQRTSSSARIKWALSTAALGILTPPLWAVEINAWRQTLRR